jgi:hypothetical protein
MTGEWEEMERKCRFDGRGYHHVRHSPIEENKKKSPSADLHVKPGKKKKGKKRNNLKVEAQT